MSSTETALAIMGTLTPVEFFKPGGSKSVLESYKAHIRAEAAKLDISTKPGRDALASLAYSVSRNKTATDDVGKDLVEGWKSQSKVVDAERKFVRDEHDDLRDEVRKPLTEWEEADKKRIAGLEYKVITMSELGTLAYGASTEDIESRLESVNALAESMTDMMEFASRAELVTKQTREALNGALAQSKARDAQAAEMARLQAEEVARKQRENEERIRLEAKQEAERRAEVERQRIERERNEAEARAKQEEARRVAAEAQAARDAEAAEERRLADARAAELRRKQAEMEAEQAKKDAEARHAEELKQAEEKRQREAKEAEERVKQERLKAIIAERERADAEHRQALADADKRENNRKHAAKVNNEARNAIVGICGLTDELATAVVTAIAKGQIPHTKISY